jgi:hypothetical protein
VWEVLGERESLIFGVLQSMVVVVVLWDGRVSLVVGFTLPSVSLWSAISVVLCRLFVAAYS